MAFQALIQSCNDIARHPDVARHRQHTFTTLQLF